MDRELAAQHDLIDRKMDYELIPAHALTERLVNQIIEISHQRYLDEPGFLKKANTLFSQSRVQWFHDERPLDYFSDIDCVFQSSP